MDHFEGAWQLYARVQRCAVGASGLQELRGATRRDFVSEFMAQNEGK